MYQTRPTTPPPEVEAMCCHEPSSPIYFMLCRSLEYADEATEPEPSSKRVILTKLTHIKVLLQRGEVRRAIDLLQPLLYDDVASDFLRVSSCTTKQTCSSGQSRCRFVRHDILLEVWARTVPLMISC